MNVSKPQIEWDQVAAASMDGVGLIDGGNLVYANETLADTYGYDDPNELVGEPWHTCYAPDERERFERDVLPEARNGTGWRGEATGLRADGSTFAQEVSFAAAGDEGLVWVVREVPGRTERERDLRAARRFNEELVENAPFGMFRLDEDRRITYENRGRRRSSAFPTTSRRQPPSGRTSASSRRSSRSAKRTCSRVYETARRSSSSSRSDPSTAGRRTSPGVAFRCTGTASSTVRS